MAITLYGSKQAIIQVVQTVKTDFFSASSSSAVDITGMSATITPSSSSNKILVSVNMTYGTDNDGYPRVILLRNGTSIYLGDASGSATRVSIPMSYGVSGTTTMLVTPQMKFLDSPSTTSAVTYKLQVSTYLGRLFCLNRTSTNSDPNGNNISAPSTITLMEVAYA